MLPLYLILVDVVDDNRPSHVWVCHEQLFVSILNEMLCVMWSVAISVEKHPKLETPVFLFQYSAPTSYVRRHRLVLLSMLGYW
jgi:hypothetical protein